MLQKKKLFNPEAKVTRGLIGSETTNIMILSDNRYPWSKKMYDTMMENFWKPEEISLGKDTAQFRQDLTDSERDTFKKIISFLVFLDSLQTTNLPNIADYITEPEVTLLLAIQQYQEALHSQSYAYILESIVSADERREIYDIAIKDKYLVQRNKYIADYYEEFIQHQSEEGFVKVIMANYILESLYFYSGFAFFYNLARNGKMSGVAKEISYINRDELTHVVLFQNMFKELRKEKPYLFTSEMESMLTNMVKEAVEHEVEWANYAIGNRIDGLPVHLVEQYIKFLANNRLKAINLEPLYPEITRDPLPFVTRYTKFNDVKTDFFAEKPINYSKATDIDELDDIEF